MTRIEERLRSDLAERANALQIDDPEPVPADVRRRTRRRQVASTAAAGLATILAIGLIVTATVTLTRERRAPLVPATPPASDQAPGEWTVVARGSNSGTEWTYSIGHRPEGWCTRLQTPSGGGFACGFRPDREIVSPGISSSMGEPTFIEGVLSPEVGRVVIELDSGERQEVPILRPPREIAAPFNAFVAVMSPQRDISGEVVALDDRGGELRRVRIEHPSVHVDATLPENAVEVASGVYDDQVYRIAVQRRERDWCMFLVTSRDGHAMSCASSPGVGDGGGFHAGNAGFVFGAIPEHADDVRFITEDGREFEGIIYEPDGFLGAPFHVYVLGYRGDPTGEVIVYDASGTEIDRYRWPPQPQTD